MLVLIGAIELARGPGGWLWGAAAAYLLARVAHALGMERPAPNRLRAGGIGVTLLVLLGLAGWALAIGCGLGAGPGAAAAPVVLTVPRG